MLACHTVQARKTLLLCFTTVLCRLHSGQAGRQPLMQFVLQSMRGGIRDDIDENPQAGHLFLISF